MDKLIQAKHLTDDQMVLAVTNLGEEATRVAICALFPNVPAKVTASKIRQMVLKGKLYGCSSDICARAGRCRFECVNGFRVVIEA